MYKNIIDYIVANDLEFKKFRELYKEKFQIYPPKEILEKALLYFETGNYKT